MAARRGRPPIEGHGRHRYNRPYGRGRCRCQVCKADQARYQREIKARRSCRDAKRLTVLPMVGEAMAPAGVRGAKELGPVAAGVAAELAEYPAAECRPGVVAACLRLAADIDNPSYGSSHAMQVKQLVLLLDSLARPRRGGKLAQVVAMADRRASGPGKGA